MAFEDAFKSVKQAFKGARASKIKEHLAIQINLTDEDSSGIMYIEVADGKLRVEPYDYHDRDAMFTVGSKDFIKMISGKISYEKAIEKGLLGVNGNPEKAAWIKNIVIPSPAKKTAAKKAPVKKKAAVKEVKEVKKAPVAKAVKETKEAPAVKAVKAEPVVAVKKETAEAAPAKKPCCKKNTEKKSK